MSTLFTIFIVCDPVKKFLYCIDLKFVFHKAIECSTRTFYSGPLTPVHAGVCSDGILTSSTQAHHSGPDSAPLARLPGTLTLQTPESLASG